MYHVPKFIILIIIRCRAQQPVLKWFFSYTKLVSFILTSVTSVRVKTITQTSSGSFSLPLYQTPQQPGNVLKGSGVGGGGVGGGMVH